MSVPSTHLHEPTEPQTRSAFSVLSEPVAEGCVHVTMAGDLDLAAADRSASALARALDEADTVLCHLDGLRFIDLCGLQSLLDATARARREGARLTVMHSPSILTRILTLLRMHDALDVDGDATSDGRESLRLVARRGEVGL